MGELDCAASIGTQKEDCPSGDPIYLGEKYWWFSTLYRYDRHTGKLGMANQRAECPVSLTSTLSFSSMEA